MRIKMSKKPMLMPEAPENIYLTNGTFAAWYLAERYLIPKYVNSSLIGEEGIFASEMHKKMDAYIKSLDNSDESLKKLGAYIEIVNEFKMSADRLSKREGELKATGKESELAAFHESEDGRKLSAYLQFSILIEAVVDEKINAIKSERFRDDGSVSVEDLKRKALEAHNAQYEEFYRLSVAAAEARMARSEANNMAAEDEASRQVGEALKAQAAALAAMEAEAAALAAMAAEAEAARAVPPHSRPSLSALSAAGGFSGEPSPLSASSVEMTPDASPPPAAAAPASRPLIEPIASRSDALNRLYYRGFGATNKQAKAEYRAKMTQEISDLMEGLDAADPNSLDQALRYYQIGTELLEKKLRLTTGRKPIATQIAEPFSHYGYHLREEARKAIDRIVRTQGMPHPDDVMQVLDNKTGKPKVVKVSDVLAGIAAIEKKLEKAIKIQPSNTLENTVTMDQTMRGLTRSDQMLPKDGLAILKRLMREERNPTQKEARKLIELKKAADYIRYKDFSPKIEHYMDHLDRLLPRAPRARGINDEAKQADAARQAKAMLRITDESQWNPKLREEADKIAALLMGKRTGLSGIKDLWNKGKPVPQEVEFALLDKAEAKAMKHRLPEQVTSGTLRPTASPRGAAAARGTTLPRI